MFACFCAECIRKRSANDRKISELQREIDKVKSDTEATLLEQKITDKKISNVIKSQERLKDELEKIKIQRDTLSLEMVDLELGTLASLCHFLVVFLGYISSRLFIYFQKWKREREIRSCNGTPLNARATFTKQT